MKARGVAIRYRVKWQKVGNKYSVEFFKLVRQKNTQVVVSKLRDKQGKIFMKKEDHGKICLDFYKDLYEYKTILEDALREVMNDLLAIFLGDMNESVEREIAEKELSPAILSMTKRKAP